MLARDWTIVDTTKVQQTRRLKSRHRVLFYHAAWWPQRVWDAEKVRLLKKLLHQTTWYYMVAGTRLGWLLRIISTHVHLTRAARVLA